MLTVTTDVLYTRWSAIAGEPLEILHKVLAHRLSRAFRFLQGARESYENDFDLS
jgi:hypothetical protein